jgi:hypothetical protein
VALEEYLPACRITAWRSNVIALPAVDHVGRRRYIHSLPKGFADISGVLPEPRKGVCLFIECKSLRGQLTPHQARWQDRMRALGCVVLTIKSIDDLRQGLRAAGVEAP